MADFELDFDDLGKSIQGIIDRAINSKDYQKLNQTISQAVEKAVDAGSEAVRKVVDSATRVSSAASGTGYQEVKDSVVVQKKNLPVLYGKTGGKTAIGVLKTVGGSLLSFVTFAALLSGIIVDALIAGAAALTVPMGFALAGFGAGIWLIGSGVRGLKRINRFKLYRRMLGSRTYCALEKLAQSVGKSVKYVRRELRQMIGEGLFLQGHLDREETYLITSNETYRHYEQSRLQLEERQRREAAEKLQKPANAHAPQVQEVLDRGNAFIAQIRKCNDDIPGQEISQKIDRMENIVRRIFDRAQAHPEIVPDLKKMMDYYLPMTVKLLRAYADMDAQPIQGQNIENSKREIEATLDTLNLAFERLLDDLFKDTAMDVSSDISVLNTLLAQEGLTEDDLTKMKKQQNLQITGTGE